MSVAAEGGLMSEFDWRSVEVVAFEHWADSERLSLEWMRDHYFRAETEDSWRAWLARAELARFRAQLP